MGKIYINSEEQHNKFWSYDVKDGNCVVIAWGRVGTGGQNQVKKFSSDSAMWSFINDKVAEKERKGYKESTVENLQNEKNTALALGVQYKISKMTFVDRKGNKLTKIGDYDPSRYVYVEGTINFGVLTTTPGSGPIVFIAYGGDAADVAGVCPLGPGASIFLGKGGSNSTNAPQAYLLAVNGGLCIDKAKFGSYGALGGMSGKTLFFGSNSGNPFSLQLNSSFPLDAVPVNLSWKAAEYSRVY
jgi:predicted DNA-binding WGR domain protein